LGLAKAIGETTEFTTPCGPSLVLTAGNGCLQEAPWADPASSLRLGSVQPDTPMSFWLNAPPEELALNGVLVEVHTGDPITHDTLNVLLEDKISYFINHLKVLKVVNSPSSKQKLLQILAYFQDLENNLPPPTD